MRQMLLMISTLVFIYAEAAGQSVKKVKTEVRFKNLADYTTIETTRIEGEKMRTDSKSEIKGHGVLKDVAIKLFLKPGDTGEITNLPDRKIYDMDHKKKTYEVREIKPYTASQQPTDQAGEMDNQQEQSGDNNQPAENDTTVKIIRREFKVVDTGEKKTINNFDCSRYTIMWLVQWENTETKEHGTDSLFTNVWTTPVNGSLQKVSNDEMEFNSAYMKKMGFDMPVEQQKMLGLQWITIMNSVNHTNDNATKDLSSDWKQMDKIKGMPIVVDGSYFAIRPDRQNEEVKKEESKPKTVRGLFNRFAKKTVEKKLEAPKETGPDLHFYTEVMQYGPGNFGYDIFSVPSDYKKK